MIVRKIARWLRLPGSSKRIADDPGLPETARLREHVDALVREAFAPHEPRAPNVDGAAGGERWHWYRRIRTGQRLVDVLSG